MPKKDTFSQIRDQFGGNIIHYTEDEHGEIFVIDRNGERLLKFNYANNQSYMKLNNWKLPVSDYIHAMLLVLAFIKPKHITGLGLGGGSLLKTFDHIMPEVQQHFIELRLKVYEIAIEFFKIPSRENIKITIADAREFLDDAKLASTDIIFSDIYLSTGMDPLQTQENFLKQSQSILSKHGWLVINHYDNTPNGRPILFKQLKKYFSAVFYYLNNNDSCVIFAGKIEIDDIKNFQTEVKALEKLIGVRFQKIFEKLEKVRS